jgi:lipoyl(octanoyl) transferase
MDRLMPERVLEIIRLCAPVSYNTGLEIQRVHAAELERKTEPRGKLILLQHTPVYTLGRKTDASHLTGSEDDLHARTGAQVVRNDRGGSVTYHGPGQLMGYLHLNLQAWQLGIHQHLDLIEDGILRAMAALGVKGHRVAGMTGVWIGEPGAEDRKVCAIGVSARRWVTYHGFCLNVDMDLAPYKEIVACGLEGKGVTTLAAALGRGVDITEVEGVMSAAFGAAYGARTEVGMV